MPRPRTPAYRHYKPKNLGLVVLDGKYHYLGRHGTAESLQRYHRLVQEWLAAPAPGATSEEIGPPLTVDQLLVAFWDHAQVHYRGPDGRPTGEQENLRLALRPVHLLYGSTPAVEFGPLALRAVREAMVRQNLGRTTINDRVNRIRRAFRWAVSVELIPPATEQALRSLAGLKRGRTEAREPRPVAAVLSEHVEAALPHLSAPVAAMVRLQWLTGMRAGEVMAMRGGEVDRQGPIWVYRPRVHKNAWRGRDRAVPIGPRAQEVLKPFLEAGAGPEDSLFRPRDAVARHHLARSATRRSRATPSEVERRALRPGSGHGDAYDRRSYRQAIVRACRRAGVPPWTPLQLRHAAATMVRGRFGLEAAQVILGHARADVTERYAERDLNLAFRVAAEVG